MSPPTTAPQPGRSETIYDPRQHKLSNGALSVITKKGWLPKAFPALDEMRERHEGLIDQRTEKAAARQALVQRFADEDDAKRREIEAALREGRSEKLPKLTPPEKRERLIAEAVEREHAASKVLVEYALDVRDQLRGEPPANWDPEWAVQSLAVPPNGLAATIMADLHERETTLSEKAADLKRQLDEVVSKIEAIRPARVWLARNSNGTRVHAVDESMLDVVAPKHTPGSKPVGADVPGFAPTHAEAEGLARMRQTTTAVSEIESRLEADLADDEMED